MAYTNVNDARIYLGIDASTDDAMLAAWIPAAKSQIDQRCRRTFEALADETKYYRYEDLISSQWEMARRSSSSFYASQWGGFDRYYLQRGSGILDLECDIASVTSVTNGNGVVIPGSAFWLLPRNTLPKNALQLKSTSTWNLGADQEIAITGRFAYSLTAPADIVLATHELIAFWYRSKDSQVFETVTVGPNGELTVPRGFPANVERILQAGNYLDPLGPI